MEPMNDEKGVEEIQEAAPSFSKETESTSGTVSATPAPVPPTSSRVWRWIKRVLLGLLLAYAVLVAFRIPVVREKQETVKVVAQIHATKLTMDDVMGKNLPPDPGGEADKTIAGVDANKNGIRDDVELAIFKEYATSSKTRAVLLQYALALQMEFTQPIVNTETVIAVAQEESRANYCVTNLASREDLDKFIAITDVYYHFVESRQINTPERVNYQKDFFNNHLGSYGDLPHGCDIDLTSLLN